MTSFKKGALNCVWCHREREGERGREVERGSVVRLASAGLSESGRPTDHRPLLRFFPGRVK